jgi:hypothetical protein
MRMCRWLGIALRIAQRGGGNARAGWRYGSWAMGLSFMAEGRA